MERLSHSRLPIIRDAETLLKDVRTGDLGIRASGSISTHTLALSRHGFVSVALATSRLPP